jgi:hypothetical protein
LNGTYSAPDLTGKAAGKLAHQVAIVTRTEGGIQIDQLNQGEARKARDPLFEVLEFERLALALYKLNDLSTHEVNRGY